MSMDCGRDREVPGVEALVGEYDCLSRGAGADGWRRWFVEVSFFESSEEVFIGVIVERDINLSMSIAVEGLGAIGGAVT